MPTPLHNSNVPLVISLQLKKKWEKGRGNKEWDAQEFGEERSVLRKREQSGFWSAQGFELGSIKNGKSNSVEECSIMII